MEILTIDCRRFVSTSAAHEYLAKKPQFPTWYGKNADALHDVLTSICVPTCVRLISPSSAGRLCGKNGETLLRVIHDSVGENPMLTII